MENDFEGIVDFPINLTKEQQQEMGIGSDGGLSEKENQLTKEKLDDIISPDIFANEYAEIHASLFHDLGLKTTRGRKRPLEEISNINENHSFSTNDASDTELKNMKKKCTDLMARVEELESNWMPRPQDPGVIQYMITIGDVLRGNQNDCNDVNDKNIVEVAKALDIKKRDLWRFKKKTSTATARNLIRSKYPNPQPHFRLGDIKRSTVDAIVQIAKYLHPNDTSSAAQLRKAIGNYFSTVSYRQKLKPLNGSEKLPEEEGNIDNTMQ